MKAAARFAPRSLIGPAIVAACAFAILVSLGVWQLQRKQWKEGLIETLSQRTTARPIELPAPSTWTGLMPDADEFRRVRLRGEFVENPLQGSAAFLYSAGSSLRDDVKGPGHFVFQPMRLPDGRIVVVNRGYIGPTNEYAPVRGNVEIVGYLRFPESGSIFVSDHDGSGTTWFVRDQRKMAVGMGWGEVAPFYIDQESPAPPGGGPKPGPLKVQLKNDHLGYALTWFGLAAGLTAVFGVWAWSQWRKKA